MLQYSQQPTRDVKHEVANVANNNIKANKYNWVAVVVAPTMSAGKTDSTEATAMVTEVTPAAEWPSTAAVAFIPNQEIQQLELLPYQLRQHL